jgi:cysteine-rich repeat protein
MTQRHLCIVTTFLLLASLTLGRTTAFAACDIGVVTFEGTVSFDTPIPGISLTDLTATVQPTTLGTGDKCEINSITTDTPDGGTGAYSVSAELTLKKGNCMGGNTPDGSCLITLEAAGSDGSSTTARGTLTLLVSKTQIQSAATISGQDISVKQSKALASLPRSSECYKWAKRQLRKRTICNFKLLKLGSEGASRCKDGCVARSTNTTPPCEPVGCDDGDFVEAILAFSHGSNDQQVDPPSATGVSDFRDSAIHKGVICQKKIGKSCVNYVVKRSKLVQKRCVETKTDSASCRATQSADSATKFNPIDSAPCVAGQTTDGGTGKLLPDVLDPCSTGCISGGTIDRKCLKACLRQIMDGYSDGLVGEIGVCGNGILQPASGEFCDDGNLNPNDCCSATCTVQVAGTEGPMGDPTCSDGGDNDCDGSIDGADTDCQ